MDDIQKKIHSFHTENIMILKSRNKKPKEKRKKVNLNFDLNMVDDQISIQLRTDECSKSPEINGDIHDEPGTVLCPENIPLPPVESIPLPAPENIPLPEEPSPMPLVPPPETIPLPAEPMTPVKHRPQSPEKPKTDRPSVLESPLPFSTRFNSTGLFSGIFGNINQSYTPEPIDESPSMSIIKSAIDRTTSLDNNLFDKDSISSSDEMRSVREILSRVNSLDTSVILSGVLRNSTVGSVGSVGPVGSVGSVGSVGPAGSVASVGSAGSVGTNIGPVSRPAAKVFPPRANDPRLNPPSQDKPKPIRRKLSISEYRKRHKGASNEESGEAVSASEPASEATESSESSSAALSPQRLDAAAAAAADELEQRLHRELVADHLPKGVFDAQPTASERQREDLSSRLRREFGLALPDDDHTLSPSALHGESAGAAKRCER